MDSKDKRFWGFAAIFLVVVGILTWAITYGIRTWQINQDIEHLGNAVMTQSSEEPVGIKALKVGYEGKTYTIDEFLSLDEIPVIVDVLIMDAEGSMSNRQAYVSCAADGSDEVRYVDGVYGRLIIPMKYSERLVDENAG